MERLFEVAWTPSGWAAATLAVCLCLLWRRTYSHWTRLGVDGPKPWPIIGDPRTLQKYPLDEDMKRARKYGKVYGTYEGTIPHLIVADAEVLYQMCVRDFDCLPNHANDVFPEKQKVFGNFLFGAKDDEWRRLRAIISPIFTTARMKRLFEPLIECADHLSDQVAEKLRSSEVVRISEPVGRFLLGSITKCGFSMKLDGYSKHEAAQSQVIAAAQRIFRPSLLNYLVYNFTPRAVTAFFGIYAVSESSLKPLADIVRKTTRSRRSSGKKLNDMLELLMDARGEHQDSDPAADSQEGLHAGLAAENERQRQVRLEVARNKATLTEDEIIANGALFLGAGINTSLSALTTCCYCLAHHPEAQAKLYEEVSGIFQSGDVDYGTLTSSPYLDCVIAESLRYVSPSALMERQLNRDYRIEKYNLDLKKGTHIFLRLHAVMHDPDYWDQPELFRPERFSAENRKRIVPGSYCPFGLGPRYCVGMKFAMMDMKLGLAKLVMQFELLPAPGTSFPPKLNSRTTYTVIENPLVRLRARC